MEWRHCDLWGLIAGGGTLCWYAKKKGTSLVLVLDILAPNVLLAQSIGRWGNFMNQEAHGGPVIRQFLENLYLPEFIIEQMNINGTYYHPTIRLFYTSHCGVCWALSSSSLYGTENSFCVKEKSL